jgi:hypothetical protein
MASQRKCMGSQCKRPFARTKDPSRGFTQADACDPDLAMNTGFLTQADRPVLFGRKLVSS